MITDPAPRDAATRKEYDDSDRLSIFAPPPPTAALQHATTEFCEAVSGGESSDVRRASVAVLAPLCEFFDVTPPPIRVLGIQPHQVREGVTTYKLYGDYTPDTRVIRVWLKTAIREKVSTPRSLLSTLLHEFCHHLDCAKLAWAESFHTRGFYNRVDQLYHLALATPDAQRRELVWVRAGGVWRIDWTRSRAPSATR